MAIAAIAFGGFSCKDEEEEKKAKTTAELIQGTWRETRVDSAAPGSNTWVNVTNILACDQDDRLVITNNTFKMSVGTNKCEATEQDITLPYTLLSNPNRIVVDFLIFKDTTTLESVSETQMVTIEKSTELEGARLKTTFVK